MRENGDCVSRAWLVIQLSSLLFCRGQADSSKDSWKGQARQQSTATSDHSPKSPFSRTRSHQPGRCDSSTQMSHQELAENANIVPQPIAGIMPSSKSHLGSSSSGASSRSTKKALKVVGGSIVLFSQVPASLMLV